MEEFNATTQELRFYPVTFEQHFRTSMGQFEGLLLRQRAQRITESRLIPDSGGLRVRGTVLVYLGNSVFSPFEPGAS